MIVTVYLRLILWMSFITHLNFFNIMRLILWCALSLIRYGNVLMTWINCFFFPNPVLICLWFCFFQEKNTRESVNEELLNVLCRRSDRAFHVFAGSLRRTLQEYLADRIDPPSPTKSKKKRKRQFGWYFVFLLFRLFLWSKKIIFIPLWIMSRVQYTPHDG